MESTPQSTITHNAVIEFASDAGVAPRLPRERGRRIKRRPSLPKRAASNRRDHAKKASPAQRREGQKTSIFERNHRQKRRLLNAEGRVVRWAGNPLGGRPPKYKGPPYPFKGSSGPAIHFSTSVKRPFRRR